MSKTPLTDALRKRYHTPPFSATHIDDVWLHAMHLEQDRAELLKALRLARAYVKATHGTLVGVIGEKNMVSPDLAVIDAAIAKAEGK